MSAPGGLEARSTEVPRLRDDWLAHALSTAPADRPAAEEAVATLYASVGRPPPEFAWVRSPAEAATLLPVGKIARNDDWQSVEAQIAAQVSDLRFRLRRRSEWQGAVSGLRAVVREGLVPAINSTLPGTLGVGWAGQHEADWQAELDTPETRIDPHDLALLAVWQTLTRTTGWWWPREGRCVMSDRPTAVHVDVNSLPHNDNGPAITFADGTSVYAWHGQAVPRWVIDEPDVVRILTEPSIEVRFCAAERLGWETYVEQAQPPLLGSVPDPGNPGFDLRLYDLWDQINLLLVVNGSVERDGTRRRYGLRTWRWVNDPLEAAAATYGLTADQYSQLLRRT
ncbi:DUF6745 domain-containing protein [Lentzea sp. NPDC058450]|uniref:DUF6745 domain-containing protein n=1 Tax=Lentzea sp. NPDC058450 TaxID=3346505 RepID=UPI003667A757